LMGGIVAWCTEPVKARHKRTPYFPAALETSKEMHNITHQSAVELLRTGSLNYTSLSPIAAFRYRTMNIYKVGTVKFHCSLLSMDFSLRRTCSRENELSDMHNRS
jgi:hypothetical protein